MKIKLAHENNHKVLYKIHTPEHLSLLCKHNQTRRFLHTSSQIHTRIHTHTYIQPLIQAQMHFKALGSLKAG